MKPRDLNKRLVLFHRDFRRFTGGHLKVWNYFNHVRDSDWYEPRIAFTSESIWDETNPWSNSREYVVEYNPESRFSLINMSGIRLIVMDELGREVDITTRDSLHPRLRNRILAEAIRVL